MTLDVQTHETAGGWVFDVALSEDGQPARRYTATLTRAFFDELTGARRVAPEAVARESFLFLLEREPAQAILRSFDLRMIGTYFPEYLSLISTRF